MRNDDNNKYEKNKGNNKEGKHSEGKSFKGQNREQSHGKGGQRQPDKGARGENRKDSGREGRKGKEGGRDGRKRFFGRGEIQLVLLKLLVEKDMHGYEMIKTLEEKSAGMYKLSPGSVYPTMQMLEDQGYVETEKVDRKTVFSITDSGKEYLKAEEEKQPEIDKSNFFGGKGPRGKHGNFPEEHEELRKKVKETVRNLFDTAQYSTEDENKIKAFEELIEKFNDDLKSFREKN